MIVVLVPVQGGCQSVVGNRDRVCSHQSGYQRVLVATIGKFTIYNRNAKINFYSIRIVGESEIWHSFALTRDLKPRSSREIPGTNDLEILLGQTREIFQ